MSKEKISYASVNVSFENFKPIKNTGFVRGECKIAYAGKNRNYTNIPKEAFEKAESTLFGIPVVGNWLEDVGNFGGHDMLLELRGNKLVIKDTTIPYGFVPQDSNPRWIDVEDENGNSKKYYVCDVIFWYEKFPEQVQFIVDNGCNQSMEIMVTDGEWDDDWEYFVIHDFYYSALCLLGRDRDDDGDKGGNDVEPCFEDAEVIVSEFGFDNKFKTKVDKMKNAFKKGGKHMDINFEAEFKTMASQYDVLKSKYSALKASYQKLDDEVKQLREYKNQKEIEIENSKKDELIRDYSLLLTKEDIADIIEGKNEMSYKEMQIQLSTVFANKALSEAIQNKRNDGDIIFEKGKSGNSKPAKNRFAL